MSGGSKQRLKTWAAAQAERARIDWVGRPPPAEPRKSAGPPGNRRERRAARAGGEKKSPSGEGAEPEGPSEDRAQSRGCGRRRASERRATLPLSRLFNQQLPASRMTPALSR
jgi:hypothetical protein